MPLHRSITFWSGLLVLAFLITAWVDSRGKESHVDWHQSLFVLFIWSRESEIGALHAPASGDTRHAFGDHHSIEFRREEIDHLVPPGFAILEAPWFPRAFSHDPDGFLRRSTVAYWILVILHLPLWSALLYYRHRRIRNRRTTLPSSSPAQPQSDL